MQPTAWPADLPAISGVDQPVMLRGKGTLDPYGTATDHQQMIYQHADHLGLPVDPVSPMERCKEFKDAVRAAKAQLRQR